MAAEPIPPVERRKKNPKEEKRLRAGVSKPVPGGRFRSLGLGLITLVLVSIAVFAVAQLLPGDVGRTILGPYASADAVARVDHQLGVDQPIPVRYWNWVTSFVRGDWGQSYLFNTAVRPMAICTPPI